MVTRPRCTGRTRCTRSPEPVGRSGPSRVSSGLGGAVSGLVSPAATVFATPVGGFVGCACESLDEETNEFGVRPHHRRHRQGRSAGLPPDSCRRQGDHPHRESPPADRRRVAAHAGSGRARRGRRERDPDERVSSGRERRAVSPGSGVARGKTSRGPLGRERSPRRPAAATTRSGSGWRGTTLCSRRRSVEAIGRGTRASAATERRSATRAPTLPRSGRRAQGRQATSGAVA